MNALKTTLLMALMAGLLVGIGGILGGKGGMTIALVIAFAMNFFTYWFSDKIVLSMSGAKQIDESQAPDLFRMVRNLSQRAGMPMPKVYIINEDQPNAFATGRNPKHAAVAATTGIMRILTYEELEGVMAHELAHVKNRDILIGTMAATIAGAISYLAQMALFFGGGRSDDDEGPGLLGTLLMFIVAPIAAMLVQMAISRTREYGADRGGAEICGNPLSLARALNKLEMASQRIPMDVNPATSHMYIVNPLTGGGIAKLFSTHPPVPERIARLEAIARGER